MVRLLTVHVRPADNVGQRLADVAHQGPHIHRQFVSAKQLGQPSSRILLNLQRHHQHSLNGARTKLFVIRLNVHSQVTKLDQPTPPRTHTRWRMGYYRRTHAAGARVERTIE